MRESLVLEGPVPNFALTVEELNFLLNFGLHPSLNVGSPRHDRAPLVVEFDHPVGRFS